MISEMRCPQWMGHMFGKTGVWNGRPGIEVSCHDCRRGAHRAGDTEVVHVLHRYDLYASLIETEIVRAPGQEPRQVNS